MKTLASPLAVPLQTILNEELAAGNEIAEISSWPPRCDVLVILRCPFKRAHGHTSEVRFAESNDSHYWKAEYRYNGGVQVLACGFK